MLDISRLDIYDYLKTLFYDVVTKNYHEIEEPTENTESEIENGFLVVNVGNFADMSEFDGEAYAEARCFVYAFIPKLQRGRLNRALYKQYEDAINEVITNVIENDNNGKYGILSDSLLSIDDTDDTQQSNQFHVFCKSFIVTINNDSNSNN